MVKIKQEKRHYIIVWIIRGLLIAHLLVIFLTIAFFSVTEQIGKVYFVFESNAEIIFLTLLALLLSFIPIYIRRKQNIYLPSMLDFAIVAFLYASWYLGTGFKFYNRFFWWDSFLHLISGIIIGLIAFLFIFKINNRFTMNLNPVLVAIFVFTVAITLGVFWEIFEFVMDSIFTTNMQQWNTSPNIIRLGSVYLGPGLRDTMSDLVLDSLGALISSFICFRIYKDDKRKALSLMRRTFPEMKEE